MITFVATAYKEKLEANMFISSLILQTDHRWKCIIYCDEYSSHISKTVSDFNDPRITVVHNEKRTGFWGHYNRKNALDRLVDTDFVIQTSIQDYFVPITVSEIMMHCNTFDFIYYESVHNHRNYNLLNCVPSINNIDWGNFAIRTSIAKSVNINNIESSVCDGLFVEDCLKIPDLKIVKINKILTVHN